MTDRAAILANVREEIREEVGYALDLATSGLVRELVGALEALTEDVSAYTIKRARSALLHAREMEGQTPTGAASDGGVPESPVSTPKRPIRRSTNLSGGEH